MSKYSFWVYSICSSWNYIVIWALNMFETVSKMLNSLSNRLFLFTFRNNAAFIPSLIDDSLCGYVFCCKYGWHFDTAECFRNAPKYLVLSAFRDCLWSAHTFSQNKQSISWNQSILSIYNRPVSGVFKWNRTFHSFKSERWDNFRLQVPSFALDRD